MPPVTGLCMSPPEIEAGIGAGDAGREEDKLRAHLPTHCVQRWWGRRWGCPDPPLSSPSRAVSGVTLPPSHTVKRESFQNIVMQTEH